MVPEIQIAKDRNIECLPSYSPLFTGQTNVKEGRVPNKIYIRDFVVANERGRKWVVSIESEEEIHYMAVMNLVACHTIIALSSLNFDVLQI